MSKLTAITLAIPCLNAEGCIGLTLQALHKQLRQPHEILVIDDGSTDRSRDIVERFPGVKLIPHGQNLGIAAARNTAWKHASGDIVAYIDADTIAHPAMLDALQHGYRNDTIAGVGGRGIELYQNNLYDRWRKEVLYQDWGLHPQSNIPFLFGLCSSYRRDILEKFDGFDPFFKYSGEDMDLSFRIRHTGLRLKYNPEARVFHLRTDSRRSISQMAYRHCYWGFLAQLKNRCFDNKASAAESMRIFLRQVFITGLCRGNFSYTLLTLQLHTIVLRAWLDSRQKDPYNRTIKNIQKNQLRWEGHKSHEWVDSS